VESISNLSKEDLKMVQIYNSYRQGYLQLKEKRASTKKHISTKKNKSLISNKDLECELELVKDIQRQNYILKIKEMINSNSLVMMSLNYGDFDVQISTNQIINFLETSNNNDFYLNHWYNSQFIFEKEFNSKIVFN
jgi:hypothetical protein